MTFKKQQKLEQAITAAKRSAVEDSASRALFTEYVMGNTGMEECETPLLYRVFINHNISGRDDFVEIYFEMSYRSYVRLRNSNVFGKVAGDIVGEYVRATKTPYTAVSISRENYCLAEACITIYMPYLDWCKLEKSPLWQQFQEYAGRLQTIRVPIPRPMGPN